MMKTISARVVLGFPFSLATLAPTVALVALLLTAAGCGTVQWPAGPGGPGQGQMSGVPSSCGQDPSRTGVTGCGILGSCQAGQWCRDADFNTCEPGCTSDNNCAGNDYCDRAPGQAVGTCTSCDNPGRSEWSDDGMDGDGAPQCNPAECEEFCDYAVCLWGNQFEYEATCVAHCRANCGEPYFDEENAAVMSCVLEGQFDLACRTATACCEANFTNQLCP